MLQTILWLVITQSVFLAGSTQSSLVHNVTVQIICILSLLPPPCPNFHITPASPVLPPAPVWQVRLKPSCPWSWFICTALQGWQDAYTHTKSGAFLHKITSLFLLRHAGERQVLLTLMRGKLVILNPGKGWHRDTCWSNGLSLVPVSSKQNG